MFVVTDDDMLESEEMFEVSLVVPSQLKDVAILPGNITTVTMTVIDDDGRFIAALNKLTYALFRDLSVIFKSRIHRL